MVEQQKQRPRRSMGIMKTIFWFLLVAALIVVAVLITRFILSIGLLSSLVLTLPAQNPVDLTLRAMNIILIFFSIVIVFLAFFGYKEATERQDLRENLKKQGERVEEQTKNLERESKDRAKKDRYMSKLNLVRIFFYLGIYDKAAYFLDEIKESFSWEVPLFRGLLRLASGDYSDALRFLEEASYFDLEPKEKARIYFFKGKVYMRIGDYPRANSNYDKCLELAPDYLDAYVNKAYIQKRQDHLDNAIELLNQAIKISDKDAQCYFNRACYHSLKGDKDKTERDLKRAVELDREWVYHALIDDDLTQNRDVVKKMLNI